MGASTPRIARRSCSSKTDFVCAANRGTPACVSLYENLRELTRWPHIVHGMIAFIRLGLQMGSASFAAPASTICIAPHMGRFFRLLRIVGRKAGNPYNGPAVPTCRSIVTANWICVCGSGDAMVTVVARKSARNILDLFFNHGELLRRTGMR